MYLHPCFSSAGASRGHDAVDLNMSHTHTYVQSPTLVYWPFFRQTEAFCFPLCSGGWLRYRFSSHPTQNSSFQRRSSQPIFWLSTDKLNLTQQKQTCIRNKICYNRKRTPTQKKTKERFGHLLWPLAWKWKGPILKA